jgi:hypothetical protein
MARLKLRELLMPSVVSQVDMEAGSGKAQRVNKIKTWAVSAGLFPCDLSAEAQQLCSGAWLDTDMLSASVCLWALACLPALRGCERVGSASATVRSTKKLQLPGACDLLRARLCEFVCACELMRDLNDSPFSPVVTPPLVLLPAASPTEAVAAAIAGWGERQLEELEAEERLAFACEKAPSTDPVIDKASSRRGVGGPSLVLSKAARQLAVTTGLQAFWNAHPSAAATSALPLAA